MEPVQGGAAHDAGVQIALAAPNLHVHVAHPAYRDVEDRDAAPEHAAVEHDRDVGAALVLLEELHDRVAARLLLAV